MHNDRLGEEIAIRNQDRNGNQPLSRSADPDKVQHHLDGLEGSSLIAAKQRDNFTTESPIRAFTDFQVHGLYAVGKGFRPSLAHLSTYLNAMEEKEGWELVQVILPRDSDGDPTILFHKSALAMMPTLLGTIGPDNGEVDDSEHLAGTDDDPVNPKHYAGRACADIGERLSANGYQILKYVWRCGRKDDPLQEIDKAIWYCQSEIALLDQRDHFRTPYLGGDLSEDFLQERLSDQPDFTQEVGVFLWNGYDANRLHDLLTKLNERRFHLADGRGLAV